MRTSLIVSLFAASLLLAGCNTMNGLGQDLKKGAEHVGAAIGKAGDKLSEAAQAASDDSNDGESDE